MNIIHAAIIGLVVGIVIAIIAYLLGGIPHLLFLRTYDVAIGAVAGLLTFLSRWLGWEV